MIIKTSKLVTFFFVTLSCGCSAQPNPITISETTFMIPMRDGTRLFTLVFTPLNLKKPAPILIERTPYGAYGGIRNDSVITINQVPDRFKGYLKDGYILVFQDMRGKFNSEGQFEMDRPLYHLKDKSNTDESTDAFDTIDWLVKNIRNNGSVGIWGVSYPGDLALQAAVDPHPALKASCPQASPSDQFLGDDSHHNGAFRLSYCFEYSYLVENEKAANSDFPFPQYDLFNWYLNLGSLKNVNEKYFHNKYPSWNSYVNHPDYDGLWKSQSHLVQIKSAQIPILHVGGYYDQEDLNGPQSMYNVMEKTDSFHRNYILLGPWSHGQWESRKADHLGKIDFESNTAMWFQLLQKQWFDYWLKGIGDGKFSEANCFQTGTNQWKQYDSWPPKHATTEKLYAMADHTAGFSKPDHANGGTVKYVSDPAKPIPYRPRPIEATYHPESHWSSWLVEDQRFISSRPDVVSFTAPALQNDFTVTGNVSAHLFAATTATDADFVVSSLTFIRILMKNTPR